MAEAAIHREWEGENARLREENARLRSALEDLRSQFTEPVDVVQAIRHGEIDALVVEEAGEEQIYSLQRFDSVYRAVIEECFPYGVWLAKPDGTLLYVTPIFLELAQTSLEEMQEKGQFHFLPSAVREAVEREWTQCRESRQPFSAEYTVRLTDGTEKTVWTQGLLTRTHDGLEHWVGVNIDVTEQRKAQQALHRQAAMLQESEERFRAFMDSSPALAWVKDEEGRYVFLNRAYERRFGVRLEDWRGKTSLEVWPEPTARQIHQNDQAAFRGAAPVQSYEEIAEPDGRRTVWWCLKFVYSDNAGKRYLGGLAYDVTEQKEIEAKLNKLNARLAEADRRKDEFLATLAHELRNPLAPIRTGLEVLQMAREDPARWEETRSMMERQTEQLIALVDDLLDVSRITRGRLELRKCPVKLADVVQSALEASRSFIAAAGHELLVDADEAPVYLDADPNRLAQVVSNLLNNAAKYTPEGGTIRLSARQEGDEVLLAVQDNGIGIPAEMQQAIFEMFTQAERYSEQGYTGLGIGLTLAQSLVTMHGGRMEVSSEGRGRGSEFTVRLPVLREAPEEERQEIRLQEEPVEGPGLRVLIVDDNKAAADMLCFAVGSMGHEVRTANDGEEAVRAAAEFLPDVVLMDLGMPKMSGYEAARHIRRQKPGENITMVALTGWGQEEDKRRTREAGFDHHLVKPAELSELEQLFAAIGQRTPRSDNTA